MSAATWPRVAVDVLNMRDAAATLVAELGCDRCDELVLALVERLETRPQGNEIRVQIEISGECWCCEQQLWRSVGDGREHGHGGVDGFSCTERVLR